MKLLTNTEPINNSIPISPNDINDFFKFIFKQAPNDNLSHTVSHEQLI